METQRPGVFIENVDGHSPPGGGELRDWIDDGSQKLLKRCGRTATHRHRPRVRFHRAMN